MKKVDVIEYSPQILKAMGKGGVFLNSKLEGKINTMTVGWGSVSRYWMEPVIIAPIRLSRFSHHMVADSGVFTISVPLNGELRRELGICGTKSGRDVDKFEECGFTAIDGREVDCPIIGEASLHIECKVVAKSLLDASMMNGEIVDKMYGGNYENGDYHTLFFGKVVDCYLSE
jgi:flavin reductase (DIM6/NTAB) family NADH-FMN oxidoreductase RutF